MEHQFYFPIYWVSIHPNWRTHIFQRGGPTTNQILSAKMSPFAVEIMILPYSPARFDYQRASPLMIQLAKTTHWPVYIWCWYSMFSWLNNLNPHDSWSNLHLNMDKMDVSSISFPHFRWSNLMFFLLSTCFNSICPRFSLHFPRSPPPPERLPPSLGCAEDGSTHADHPGAAARHRGAPGAAPGLCVRQLRGWNSAGKIIHWNNGIFHELNQPAIG